MMTYYLREKNRLPSACLAIEVVGVRVVYAIAAWNSHKDSKVFDRRKSRYIAMQRVEAIKALMPEVGPFALKYVNDKPVGGTIPYGIQQSLLREVLTEIVDVVEYPQRAREAARRILAAPVIPRVQPPEAPEGNDHDHDGA